MAQRVRTVALSAGFERGGRRGVVPGKVSSRYSSAARDWVIVVVVVIGFWVDGSGLMMRVGTVAEGLTDLFAVLDCSSFSRLIGMEVYGTDLRARAMRRRAEQEERKYV